MNYEDHPKSSVHARSVHGKIKEEIFQFFENYPGHLRNHAIIEFIGLVLLSTVRRRWYVAFCSYSYCLCEFCSLATRPWWPFSYNLSQSTNNNILFQCLVASFGDVALDIRITDILSYQGLWKRLHYSDPWFHGLGYFSDWICHEIKQKYTWLHQLSVQIDDHQMRVWMGCIY